MKYQPGDKVLLLHYSKHVLATLIREKSQPEGAWWVRKHHPGGTTTVGISNQHHGDWKPIPKGANE